MKKLLTTFVAALLGVGLAIFLYEQYRERELQKALEEAERTKNIQVNAAYIGEGLTALAQLKPFIEIYYAETEKLPCTADELDLPTEILALQARSLHEVELSGCGQLKATYTGLSGLDGGVLFLRAREIKTASDRALVWDCESPDFQGIGDFMPSCKYVPGRGDEDPSTVKAQNAAEAESASGAAVAAADTASRAKCLKGVAVNRSVFTDAVSHRVPNKRFITLGPADQEVNFFTEIIGARGREIKHRWFHDDVQIASVSFFVEGDRWRTWSSKQLRLTGPGELRVEVVDGDCSVAQESIQIEAENRVDPGTRSGWMWPLDALETILARSEPAVPEDDWERLVVDGLDDSGDPHLISAIRKGDTATALILIRAVNPDELPKHGSWSDPENVRLGLAADPFARGKDGVSAIDLAQRMGQGDVVDALVESALQMEPRKRVLESQNHAYGWRDSVLHSMMRDDSRPKRFRDGDTALIRSVRLGNERAVLTLLGIADELTSEQLDSFRDTLFEYDGSGRQPIDIARGGGFYGVEQFLRIALDKASPRWSVIRSSLSTRMDGDEPGFCRKRLLADETELYYFTQVADLEGRPVRHEWRFERELVQSDPFDVSSSVAKMHSQRRFSETDIGPWEVRAVDAQGQILDMITFTYAAVSDRETRNRDRSPDRRVCQGSSGPLFKLIQAHAPVQKIKELLAHTETKQLDLKENRRDFLEALQTGSISLTRWFLDSGFEIDEPIQHDRTPLMLAAMTGDEAMALFLIAMGAELDVVETLKKRTALVHAVTKGDLGMARILLRHGAAVNLQDGDGYAALHRAVSRGCKLELTVSLLEYGADASLQNRGHESPRDQATACFEAGTWSADTDALWPLRS